MGSTIVFRALNSQLLHAMLAGGFSHFAVDTICCCCVLCLMLLPPCCCLVAALLLPSDCARSDATPKPADMVLPTQILMQELTAMGVNVQPFKKGGGKQFIWNEVRAEGSCWTACAAARTG